MALPEHQKTSKNFAPLFFISLLTRVKSLYCLIGVSVSAWIIVEGAEAKLYQQKLSRTLLKKGKQPFKFGNDY
jgi:hypothetical protein